MSDARKRGSMFLSALVCVSVCVCVCVCLSVIAITKTFVDGFFYISLGCNVILPPLTRHMWVWQVLSTKTPQISLSRGVVLSQSTFHLV